MNRNFSHFATLRGAPFRHCFLSFPHHWKHLIAPASIPTFAIETDSRSFLLSWAGQTHYNDGPVEENVVYVSSKLLRINDLEEEKTIIVRQIESPPPFSDVTMRTATENDWRELMLNIETAQNAFLNQVRVVQTDQSFPLWLEGGIYVSLITCNLTPASSIGLILLNTRVQIFPPAVCSPHPAIAINPSSENVKNKQLELKTNVNFLNILRSMFIFLGYMNRKIEVVSQQDLYIEFKVIPYSLPSIENSQNEISKLLASHPSLVVISEEYLKTTKFLGSLYFKSKISEGKRMKPSNDNVIEASHDSVTNTLVIVIVWERLKKLFIKDDSPFVAELDVILRHRCCLLSNGLRRQLGLSIEKNATLVIFTSDICAQNNNNNNNFEVDVSVINDPGCDKSVIASSLHSIVSDFIETCPVVLNSDNLISGNLRDKSVEFFVRTRGGMPILLEKTSIHRLSINVESECRKRLLEKYDSAIEAIEENSERSLTRNEVTVHENVLRDLVRTVKRQLKLEPNDASQAPQFIMLQGSKGTGKSILLQRLAEELSGSPYFVYCKIIHLKQLKGKKVDSIQKILRAAIREGITYQPSLILLDDLDFLAPVTPMEEERGPLFEYVKHASSMIKSSLNQLKSFAGSRKIYITVVVTCCSRSNVHSTLSNPQGNYIFTESLIIPPLMREEKKLFFHSSLAKKRERFLKENKIRLPKSNLVDEIFHFDNDKIFEILDGFTLPDINSFAQRVFLEAKSRWPLRCDIDDELLFSKMGDDFFFYETVDVTNALHGFLTLASRGLNNSTQSTRLRKIGGLRDCKDLIEEMIVWPSKYPEIFSQTQLRLRSGILLYGPPGCGKTLLANSVQNYSHLSFITVKGPELLSKYIGQSEKSVRDLFQRAENCKPCVLFFDEFESIAPRRGHDNTGVTDRVVNQLLTQMDGVQGLSGVYVLAATSRPDLIDPALLRPGRLDKSINCSFPNEIERLEILQILSEEVVMSDDVELDYIAKMTDGFTGADLQSIISNAQIIAVQKVIGKSLYESISKEPGYSKLYSECEHPELTINARNDIFGSFNRTKDETNEFGNIIDAPSTDETTSSVFVPPGVYGRASCIGKETDPDRANDTSTGAASNIQFEFRNNTSKDEEINNEFPYRIDYRKLHKTERMLGCERYTPTENKTKREFYQRSLNGNKLDAAFSHKGDLGLNEMRERPFACISMEHLMKSLRETRPSVSYIERIKYESLHKMFTDSKESKTFINVKAGNRETLA